MTRIGYLGVTLAALTLIPPVPPTATGAPLMEQRTLDLTLGTARELQIALQSLEHRMGICDDKPCVVDVPTCAGAVTKDCIPPAVAKAIADNVSILSPHWNFYQRESHKVIAKFAPDGTFPKMPNGQMSDAETRANFALFDVAQVPVVAVLKAFPLDGIYAPGSSFDASPSIKAVLVPLSAD